MAQLPGTFNPDEIPEDDRNFDALPAGDYLAQVIESEINPTQNQGELLKLTFEIIDGPFERRRIWDRLNIVNANEVAQRIAQQQLASLCRATGVGSIDDTEVLHNRPVVIKVGVRNDPKYGEQNTIKKYSAAEMAPPTRSAPPRQAAAAQRQAAPSNPPPQRAAAGGGSRPWAR